MSSHRPIESQEDIRPDSDYGIMKNSMERLGVAEEEDEEDETEEDVVPPCGPIRIRNLEDLLRKLEHQPIHVSPAGSDLRLSEPEADRHYRVERTDSASGTESQMEPGGPPFYGVRKQRGDGSQFARVPEPEEDEEDFDEEGSIEEDGEDGDYSSRQFVRSASEEALPMTYAYDRNLDSKPLEKTLKRDGCEYVPSPPSDELYDGLLYDEKGFFPARAAPQPPPSSSSSTSGSQPPSGAKKKGKKKFPEYKV